MVIRIRSDNGYDECSTCSFIETETCTFCEDADQYEEDENFSLTDQDRISLRTRELMVA